MGELVENCDPWKICGFFSLKSACILHVGLNLIKKQFSLYFFAGVLLIFEKKKNRKNSIHPYMHFLNRKKYDIIVIFHQLCKKHKWSKNEFDNL